MGGDEGASVTAAAYLGLPEILKPIDLTFLTFECGRRQFIFGGPVGNPVPTMPIPNRTSSNGSIESITDFQPSSEVQ